MSMGEQRDTRQAIFDAAIAILREHGAGALTVRSVASAAGCSTTGVYTWFGSKNGLVEAIFVDGFRRFHDAQQAVLDGDGMALLALANAYREWALANPTHYQVMFQAAVPGFEPSDQARAVAWSTFDQLVEAAEATRRARHLATPVDELAHHMWATVHGYVSLEFSGMSQHDPATSERLFHDGVASLLGDRAKSSCKEQCSTDEVIVPSGLDRYGPKPMAKSVVTTIIDDIDGSSDASTITFALDGVAYSIDLGPKNEKKLRDALAPFINHADPPARRRRHSWRGQAQRPGVRHRRIAGVGGARRRRRAAAWPDSRRGRRSISRCRRALIPPHG